MPYRELSKELKEKAKIELNEDENRLQSDLAHIKDWLKKQPHLQPRLDDQWLLAFLRGSKFKLEKTKQKLDNTYTLRSMTPEFFANRDPMSPEIQEILNLGVLLPLTDKDDPLAPAVLFLRGSIFDPNKIKTENVFKTHMMILDILLMESDSFLINGIYLVLDNKCMTTAHMTPPAYAMKCAAVLKKCIPLRPKATFIFNISSLFSTVFGIIKPVLSEKIVKRVKVLSGSYEDLYKILPKKVFPNEFGGEAGPLEEMIAANKKKIESYRNWFLEDAKYGCDESKRPGKPKTMDEMFGIDGSFRKLDID